MRSRANTRDTLRSVALTDATVAETDVDIDETETVATGRNGYASTGTCGKANRSWLHTLICPEGFFTKVII